MNAIEILRDHLNIELLRLMEPIEDQTQQQSQNLIVLPEIVDGYYDLTDDINAHWIATSQPCWADYSSRDSECKTCSLSSSCKKAKGEEGESRAESRALKSEVNRVFDSKAKREVSKLSETIPQEVVLQADIVCKITDHSLLEGETHLFYPEYGIVHIYAKHI